MYEPPDLVFSFLTFTLSAKGIVALLLAFPVALILTAIVGGYSMAEKDKPASVKPDNPMCGCVMPISLIDGCTAGHWER